MRLRNFMLVCAGVLSALAFISEVKSEEPVVVEGKILVRYESSLSAQEIETIEKEFGLQRLDYMPAINTGYYRISGSEDQFDLIERLRKRAGIVLVEEDLLRTQSAAIPNDPLYGQQWYLNSSSATHINFQSAIQAFSGTTTIDVAVIDSGILLNHPEFVGKINNTWAYDYVENDTTPQDENGHGTMVASLIGAAHRNGSGMAGVCPNVRFLPLRVFDKAGRFATTTSGVLVSALQRAYDANVRIVNLSLEGGGYSAAELSMFEALNTKGILAVIAAGNGDRNTRRGINNDLSPTYPASYNASNIISVMATDSTGDSAIFSNYGSSSVDIAAPGVGVLAGNLRRATVYNDSFASGLCGWIPTTIAGGTPWQLNSFSIFATFSPGNVAGIYKYFNFSGKQGLRADLTGFFMLGFGDYVELEKWNGAFWERVDVIVGLGEFVSYRSFDISAFDGLDGYARISLRCDVYDIGAFYTRSARIESISITEISSTSTSDPEYLSVDGTSFSAPLVAGTAALLISQNPALKVSDLKTAILSTATTRSSLSGKSVTGGIVNVSAALAAAQPKQSQTISFSALPTKAYGDADFAINAAASSGLSVSYSSSDASVAAISGNTVSIVGAGTATITASQLGDSTYSSAASVQQILTINKKNLVIVADNKTKEKGQSDPILTYTSFGLLSGSSITGALSRSTGESVGTYNINQGTITAGNNYAISFTQGSFVITPQSAIISTTPPTSLAYDATNKSFAVRVTPPASAQGEYVNLASVGNPNSGYGLTANLSPSGFLTTSYVEVDGIFRASQASTKISSTGLTYSFPSSLVSSTAGGEGARNPWKNSATSTGGPTSQLNSYFVPLGIDWSLNSLFAVPSCGITFDLSKLMASSKTIEKFTFYYGMHSGNSTGDAAYAILLDGVLVSSGKNYTATNPFSNLVEVNIAPNSRFLTLVACDNGDDYYWDHSVFVDPKVYAKVAELSANCIYTGINGTIYGPSSIAPKDVGYYRLEVSSNDPNYIGTKTQEFAVTPKSATVTAVAKTKVYGAADPALTYTSSGLIGSDSLTGALTRTAGENVGTYNILVGTLSAGANYTLSYTGESLVITGNYSSWASSCGLTGNNALQNADPDNDGKNNAAEYAFGGNPATSDQRIVSSSPVPNGIKFVWLQLKDQGQVTYSPKTSTDLALAFSSWVTVNSSESNPQPLGISTDYKQMEVVLPTSAGKGFLKIEANVQ